MKTTQENETPNQAESLKEKTAKGLFYGGLSVGFQQVVGLLMGILMGRLLLPEEFGMIAMITVFSLIANELQSSGFKTALTNLSHPTHQDYNSVFWFNIIVGAFIYVLLFLSAPLIADFYHEPRLIPLCRYAFLGFVFASMGLVQSAYLFKQFQAKQMAKAASVAVVLSSTVAVGMAACGFSYWSLATQTNLYIATNTFLLWHYSPWRPTWEFSLEPIRRMFRFSYKLLLSCIINDVNNSVLNVLLGSCYSSRAAGIFNQAYQWNYKCVYLLQGMLSQVSQPVMVIAREDRDRQLHILRKLIRFTSFLSFPLLFGFSLVAVEFITATITDRWIESARIIQFLGICGAFMPLVTVFQNVLLSHGRSAIYMLSTAALFCCIIGMALLLAPLGMWAMVKGFVAIQLAWVLVWHYFVWKVTGYSLKLFIRDTMPFALTAAAVMATVYLITATISHPLLLLGSRVILAALLYYGVMKMAHVVVLDECMAFIRQRLHKKK